MEATKLLEGISLLIDLAQRGEIDPWDVQVIEVIDRYLNQLVAPKLPSLGAYEKDLSQSGQAFLSASMLVLFKANTLINILESPTTDSEPLEDANLLEAENGVGAELRVFLDRQLRRRPAALPPQKRQVTLKELIDQLQLMAKVLQQQEAVLAPKTRTRSLRSLSRSQAARAIAQLAHQENLTEVAAQIEQFLNHHSYLLALEQDWLNLDQLVELWTQTQPELEVKEYTQNKAEADTERFVIPLENCYEAAEATMNGQENIAEVAHGNTQHNNRVSVFWALLLLSAQSKVELVQEEFYQEIKIRKFQISESQCKGLGAKERESVELTDGYLSIE